MVMFLLGDIYATLMEGVSSVSDGDFVKVKSALQCFSARESLQDRGARERE